MKKVLLLAVAMILVAGIANAAPYRGYIGLFVGPSSNVPEQTAPDPWNCEIWYTGGGTTYTEAYVWVWCLPSVNGLKGAEFMLVPPDEEETTVIFGSPVRNPLITNVLGDIWVGIEVVYPTCQTDWVWTHYMRVRLYDDVGSALIIVPNPISDPFTGWIQFANCNTGYPPEDAMRLCYVCFNMSCWIATKDASWGAIKSLF